MQAFDVVIDNEKLARHLSDMVRCKTVSCADQSRMDFAQFDMLHSLLQKTYPLLHRTLEREIINGYGLLYRWKGSGVSGLAPILLTAHQDVAPADETAWQHNPFEGQIADGFVWGRGTMDCKCLILGHMEAIEALLAQGFAPDRDVYLAYGFDEEVLGLNGALKIAEALKSKGLHFDFVLDEGGMYVRGEDFGVPEKLLAQIGIFEKGYVDIQLTVLDEGGHASRPKDQTALGILCHAIDAVERHPFEASVSEALNRMYQALLPHLKDKELKAAVEGLATGEQKLIALLLQTPQGNAMVRSTAAATMAWASPAPNVLPQRAEAIFNLRLSDKDSVEYALKHLKQAIADDRVSLSAHRGYEASGVSDIACQAYDLLQRTISDMQPDAIAVPAPMVARTDARLYDILAQNIYRFGPFIGHMDLRDCVHGTDERTPVDQLGQGVNFYMQLLWRFCSDRGRNES